jgi:uncharacterized protein YdaU (DUF1376 family)
LTVARSPAFQFYANDFRADANVTSMTLEEVGAYILLLTFCWTEGGISQDPKALMRLLRTDEKTWSRIWPALAPCFSANGEKYVQKRMELVREKQEGYREMQSLKGNARWLHGNGDGFGRPDDLLAAAKKKNNANRSARLSAARKLGQHTAAEWAEMRQAYGRCLKCGTPESELGKGESIKDHIIPLYQGGSDSIQNLQPMCGSCNSAKGADSTDLRIGLPETRLEWLPNAFRAPTGRLPERLPNAYSSSSTSSSTSVQIRESAAYLYQSSAPAAPTLPAYVGKQRPIPGYRRLRIFRWMLDDMLAMLGDHAEAFDLDKWLITLDASPGLLPVELWPWIKEQVLEQAAIRGYGAAETGPKKKTATELLIEKIAAGELDR